MITATGNVKASIISSSEIEYLKQKVADILAQKGMIVEHPEVLACLKKAGAEVDDSTCLVKFPYKLQEEALSHVPKEMVLAGVDSKHDLQFPHPKGLFYTRCITGAQQEYTREGTYEDVTLERFAEWIQLVHNLENVDFYSLLTITPASCPEELQDIYALKTALENTTKHGWVQPISSKSNKWFIEMAAARMGGLENLQKHPCISMISCCTSPLYLKHMDAEAIYQGAINKIPTQCCTLPTIGCTSPMTPQGTAVQGCAEVLGMIIIAQCICPGLPVTATCEPFSVDLNTYYTVGSSIELAKTKMLITQLIKEGWGLFCHISSGGSDSPVTNGQCACDAWVVKYPVALAGCDIIGDLGYIDASLSMSKYMLMLEDEYCGMLKSMNLGVEISDEAIGMKEIMATEHHLGNYVNSKHSFRHFKEFYRPKYDLLRRENRDKWQMGGSKDLFEYIADVYEKRKNKFEIIEVADSVKHDMNDVIAAATKDYLG